MATGEASDEPGFARLTVAGNDALFRLSISSLDYLHTSGLVLYL